MDRSQKELANNGHFVIVQTKSGKTLVSSCKVSEVLNADVFTYEDATRKFEQNTRLAGICSIEETNLIVDSVSNLEKVNHVGDFIKNHLSFNLEQEQ